MQKKRPVTIVFFIFISTVFIAFSAVALDFTDIVHDDQKFTLRIPVYWELVEINNTIRNKSVGYEMDAYGGKLDISFWNKKKNINHIAAHLEDSFRIKGHTIFDKDRYKLGIYDVQTMSVYFYTKKSQKKIIQYVNILAASKNTYVIQFVTQVDKFDKNIADRVLSSFRGSQ